MVKSIFDPSSRLNVIYQCFYKQGCIIISQDYKLTKLSISDKGELWK